MLMLLPPPPSPLQQIQQWSRQQLLRQQLIRRQLMRQQRMRQQQPRPQQQQVQRRIQQQRQTQAPLCRWAKMHWRPQPAIRWLCLGGQLMPEMLSSLPRVSGRARVPSSSSRRCSRSRR